MNKVGNRDFAWPIRSYNICPTYLVFFSFGDGEGCWIFLVHMVFSPRSHNVPIKFSMDSQDILEFLNVFLPCSQKHLTLYHMFYSIWKLYTCANIGTYMFLCLEWIHLYWWVSKVLGLLFVMGQSKRLISTTPTPPPQLNFEGTPQ
jgi:hypothetical protein